MAIAALVVSLLSAFLALGACSAYTQLAKQHNAMAHEVEQKIGSIQRLLVAYLAKHQPPPSKGYDA